MTKRIAKRIYRDFTPAEKAHWERTVVETKAEREKILQKGRAALAVQRRGDEKREFRTQ